MMTVEIRSQRDQTRALPRRTRIYFIRYFYFTGKMFVQRRRRIYDLTLNAHRICIGDYKLASFDWNALFFHAAFF
jgi:hypothetical protein